MMDDLERLVRLVEQARAVHTFLSDMAWEMLERFEEEGEGSCEVEGGPTWLALYERYAHARDLAAARLKRRRRELRRAAPRGSMARRSAVKLATQMRTGGKLEF